MVLTGDEDRVATVWVDTNTLLEVYSHGDLYDVVEKGGPLTLEQREVRMRGSLWMAMALCQRLVRSKSYQHESEQNILRNAPPGTSRGRWTVGALYILGDGGVFDGWDSRMTDQGAHLSNPERDRFMISQCRDNGMTFVSRDRKAIALAATEMVLAMEPQQYGASVLTEKQAGEMFMKRLRVAVESYPSRYPPEEHAQRVDEASVTFEVYEELWTPVLR
jgi:hypothetical protein